MIARPTFYACDDRTAWHQVQPIYAGIILHIMDTHPDAADGIRIAIHTSYFNDDGTPCAPPDLESPAAGREPPPHV